VQSLKEYLRDRRYRIFLFRKKTKERERSSRTGVTPTCGRRLPRYFWLSGVCWTHAPSPDPVTNEMCIVEIVQDSRLANQSGCAYYFYCGTVALLRVNDRPDTSMITSANKCYIFITTTVC